LLPHSATIIVCITLCMACTSLPATRVRVHASIAIAIAEDVAIYIGLVNDHMSMAGAGRRHMHGAASARTNDARDRRSLRVRVSCSMRRCSWYRYR
jgi:hypothetical protein